MTIQNAIDEIKTIFTIIGVEPYHYIHEFDDKKWFLFKKKRTHTGFVTHMYGVRIKLDFEIVNKKFIRFRVMQEDIDTNFGAQLVQTNKLSKVLELASSALGGAILV